MASVRSRVLLMLCIALAPVAAAEHHPLTIVLSDWTSGSWLVGTPASIPLAGESVNEARFAVVIPECHRTVLLDLAYSPNATNIIVPGVGSASVAHEVRASLWNGSEEISSVRIIREGFGHPVGLAPTAGTYEVRLRLSVGADVEWSSRLRGLLLQDEPGCSHPIEG